MSADLALTNPTTFEEFEKLEVQGEQASIFLRRFGSGPPVLLLHGFPQTPLMWRTVAPLLAQRFTVICADLRGYGRSSCPPSRPDHSPYAKRAMANDMVAVMEGLGYPRFSVAGHDRGGRVAYAAPCGPALLVTQGRVEMWRGFCRSVGLRYVHSSDGVRSVSLLPERKRPFAKPPL